MSKTLSNDDLNDYYRNNVEISKAEKKRNVNMVIDLTRKILDGINEEDERFALDPVYQGSYWQGLKVESANEFDICVKLQGLSDLVWTSELLPNPRYRIVNRETGDTLGGDSKVETVPNELRVVLTKNQLRNPPIGAMYLHYHLDKDAGKTKEYWRDVGDGDDIFCDNHIVPFLAKKQLRRLLLKVVRENDYFGDSVKVTRKIHGPAITLTICLENDDLDDQISVDFAVLMPARLTFEDWLGWPRPKANWPSGNKVAEIKSRARIDLVAKFDHYWQMSFAAAEKELMIGIDEDGGCRKKCLRIMKKVNSDVWCPTSKPVISSFILKNIFFWECETYPRSNDWQQQSLSVRFQSMTNRLFKCIKQQRLQLYFYPEVNLLKGKDEDDLRLASDKIEKFLACPSLAEFNEE